MSSQNQLSRYGSISRNIPELAPSAKVFLVGDSDDTTYGIENLAAEFPPDGDGVVRVYSTIQAAVNAAAANRGDIVLVAPNHIENFTRADTWATAGVQIIGMGNGETRPGLTYNDAGATVNLRGNGIRVSNLYFLASTDSATTGIPAVNMDTGFFGQRFDNNIFSVDANTDDFKTMIRLGAKESLIENNRFITGDTFGCAKAISIVGGDPDNSIIMNNYFWGNYDSAGDTASDSTGSGVIAQDTSDTNDTNLSGLIIENNKIISTDTRATFLIRLSAGYTNRSAAINNQMISYDTGSADSDLVAFAGMLGTNNTLQIGDSDVRQSIVNGFQAARLHLDS